MLILLSIMTLLVGLRGDLKDQWFSLLCQTRSSLLSRPKISFVDHIFTMSSLVISAPAASLSTSSKLVGIWYGILFRVRRYFISSRLSYWPQICISGCLPRDTSWFTPIGWKILVDINFSSILLFLLRVGAPYNPP